MPPLRTYDACMLNLRWVCWLTVLLLVPELRASDAPAKRIITIAPHAAEIVCALGACDSLVGVSKFCVYPPELASRTRVGGLFDADLEKIVVLGPDLIVLRGHNDSVERLANNLGIRIFHDDTDTIPGISTCVRELGKRVDRRKTADRLILEFESRLEAVRQRVAGKRRPTVLVTVSRLRGKLANILTTSNGTFLDEMIEIAGGKNAFGHLDMTYPQVSPESITAQRPDVIIEFMPGMVDTSERRASLVREWRGLSTVPGVANDRIYVVTADHGLMPSPRFAAIVEQVSRLLHPESPK